MPNGEEGLVNIGVKSILEHHTRQPLVSLEVGERAVQVPPVKAREIALMLLEAAEAAQRDAFMMRFAMEKLGLDERRAAALLLEFRQLRTEGGGGGWQVGD